MNRKRSLNIEKKKAILALAALILANILLSQCNLFLNQRFIPKQPAITSQETLLFEKYESKGIKMSRLYLNTDSVGDIRRSIRIFDFQQPYEYRMEIHVPKGFQQFTSLNDTIIKRLSPQLVQKCLKNVSIQYTDSPQGDMYVTFYFKIADGELKITDEQEVYQFLAP